MSKKYSKADLRHIAEDMIEDLRECEDGTVTTTGRLARDYGYDDMETFDLFDLHDVHGVEVRIQQDIFMAILHSVKRCKRSWMRGNGSLVDVASVLLMLMASRFRRCRQGTVISARRILLRHRYSLRRRRIWRRIIEILLHPSSSQLTDSLKVILRLQFQKMMREQLLR